MASFFSDYGLMWYLEELNKKEFMKFKEVLKQEIIQYGLKQIPWTEVKKASRESLANLLVKYYEEEKAWDVTFRIFQNINRKDLSERAAREIAGHSKIYKAHLKNKLTQEWSRKFNIPIQDFLKQKFTKDECNRFEHLFVSRVTERKTHTVLLKGVAGIGKTLMLAKLMLAWSEGLVFQNKFSYIFYLCCQELKQLKTASLAELMSREWPGPSAPIVEIMSQPEKLLFIIDSLEGLNCDLTEPELELCDNWLEKRPVNILLSSLLRRKIVPKASLLLTATPETFDKLEDRIEYTEMKIMMGFDENSRKMYIRGLFQDKNRAQEVLRLVRGNEQVFSICQVPLLCWVVATCLKNEIEKGRDPASVCRRTTSVYTTYILDLFTPQSAQYPSKKSRELLQNLCCLAAEGVWTDKFVFSEEDLRKKGILNAEIATLLDIKLLLKSREPKCFYTFFHPSIQEFCAAIFYLVKSHRDHPSKDVLSIKTLLYTFLKKVKVQWIFLGCFIFGLLHKSEQEKLEVFFGYQLSQKVKQTLYQCLETISVNEELQEELDSMKLFYCLFEMEDDIFTMQAMNFLQYIKFVAKDYSDLIVAAYCLKYCSTLKKLSFSTQDILQHEQEFSYMEKLLVCWQDVCSVLIRSNHIQVLQVKDTNLDESAFLVLYNHLKHPNCTPQVLEVNNVSFLCDNYLFFDLLTQNRNLQHLNLSLTFLSHLDVKLLCDVLSQTECNIEKLLVAGCQLSPDDCKIFASILISSKTLRHLNITSNSLDKGIYSMCKALCHPDCVLKHLVLANCFLGEQCWDYLSDVLRRNKTLSHLDISSNNLKDKGLKVLCKALSLPSSVLKSLCLRYCLITTSGCEHLAEVLSSNQNLRSLQLSNNKIEDSGVKILCDAIKQPNCHLENLGLEACELTSACCEDLASTFTQSKTLWGVNLLQNALDLSGLALLCEALKQHNCTLHVLGLRITDFDKETQEFLIAEEEKNPYLTILSSI
ncbi:NACHT, LRR and PYD domains-containing protein 4 isoform X1 [Onychomys torridus]|uniref:NACHT, LRR and PYD domains-containing protein 4 isoform X1 n=1 Tax=Onychomys torridus TaxID=38674 RepID=UPI00167FAD5B|nr:NACHT, LRR and PYD domains-containing protein 4 isoform X1 [Onychomys torridus]